VQIFKSITAREVFRRKPSVKKELWGGEFWSDGYYVATVGERANWDIVESYVQKTRSTQNLPKAVQIVWVNRLLGGYNGDRINSILYSDLKDSLPGDMLTKVDWMSMKNSLEVRVPLLDHRVVEMAFRMKRSLKLNKGKSKYILKETFKDLLPTNLYKRPKAGFEVPISRWLKTDLKFLIDQYLAKEKLREQGIFDFEIVDGLIQKHLSNKTDTSWMLWNLIVFQHWYQNYFL
jgi:asparagine synthetase B (glutamine-hydrolysing)